MARKRFGLGMLVMALAFGTAVTGCDNNTGSIHDGNPIVGIWDYTGGEAWIEFTRGGAFRLSHDMFRGTFTTGGGTLILRPTHVFSDGGLIDRDQARLLLIALHLEEYGREPTTEELNAMLESVFESFIWTYSIAGNILTIIDHEDNTVILARRP